MDDYINLENPILKIAWEDCSVSFDCPRCGKDCIADSQDGWDRCDKCGIEYILNAKIEFRTGQN